MSLSSIDKRIQQAGADFARTYPTIAQKIYNTTHQAPSTYSSVVPSIDVQEPEEDIPLSRGPWLAGSTRAVAIDPCIAEGEF